MTDKQLNGNAGSNGQARKLADILKEAGVTSTGSGGRRRRRDESHDPVDEIRVDEIRTVAPAESFGSELGSLSEFAGSDFMSSDSGSSTDFMSGEFSSGEFSSGEFSSGEFSSLSAYLLADPETRPPETRPPENRPPENRPPENRPPESRFPDTMLPETVLPTSWPPETRPPETRPRETRLPTRQPFETQLPKARVTAWRNEPKAEVPRTDTGPVTPFGWAARGKDGEQGPGAKSNASVASALDLAAAPATEQAAGSRRTRVTDVADKPTSPARLGTSHAKRSASPLASSPPDDPDEEESALPLRGGAASWAILGVELLAALGLGVAAWYAFSALWDLLPYVAAFTGPLVVTGLVAVAGALRSRTGRNPLGLPTLCILVFAGTVLVVLPAATVIIP